MVIHANLLGDSEMVRNRIRADKNASVLGLFSFTWIRNSKLVGYPDVGKCHVTGWAGVFEETPGKKTSEIYIHRHVRV